MKYLLFSRQKQNKKKQQKSKVQVKLLKKVIEESLKVKRLNTEKKEIV